MSDRQRNVAETGCMVRRFRHRLPKRLWTPREDQMLLGLPRYPNSGHVKHGELLRLARRLGRTQPALATRLCELLRNT